MKSDDQIRCDVIAELAWDPAVTDERRVGVAVKDGVVTLTGTMPSYMQKWSVERAARRVAGVRGLALELHVAIEPGLKRTDAEIAEAAVSALQWNTVLPPDRVRVEVEDGWVTLAGSVDLSFQSRAAQRAVQPLLGVRGVTNKLEVSTRVDAPKIKEQISAAFARRAQRDARHLAIDVDEAGIVTLRGSLDSMGEHDAAIGTAWAAPGVSRVIDRIEVAA